MPDIETVQPRVLQFVYRFPVLLVGIVGYLYAVTLFLNLQEDTTAVSNAAVIMMATLAALSFSYARIAESENLRDTLSFAGERLLHGTILVLVASILKYFVLALPGSTAPVSPTVANAAGMSLGLIAALVFSNGVLFAHTGLQILNNVLLLRLTRHEDWDSIW